MCVCVCESLLVGTLLLLLVVHNVLPCSNGLPQRDALGKLLGKFGQGLQSISFIVNSHFLHKTACSVCREQRL